MTISICLVHHAGFILVRPAGPELKQMKHLAFHRTGFTVSRKRKYANSSYISLRNSRATNKYDSLVGENSLSCSETKQVPATFRRPLWEKLEATSTIFSALHALCSIHRLYAVQSTAQCTTCIVFNTPSVCRTEYYSVHYMHCVQFTVSMP